MNQKYVKPFAAVIAIVLALLLILPFVLDIVGSASAAESVSSLNNKLDNLEQQKADLKKKIANVESQQKSAKEKKAVIDQNIAVTNEEISTINRLISVLDQEIAQNEAEISRLQGVMDQSYVLFKKRIRAMEEEGSVSYLSVLLSADSFSSMLSRAEVINSIIDHDKKLMDQIKASKAEIEEKNAKVAKDKEAQEAAKKKLSAKRATLRAEEKEADQLLGTLNAQEEQYKKEYEAAESAMQSTKADLKKLLNANKPKNTSESSTKNVYTSIKFTWPTPGYSLITSPYGTRFDPIFKTRKMHTGIDIGAPMSAKIVAAASGTVVVAGWSSRGYGNYVVIQHDGTFSTLYAHMSKILVSQGQKVEKGDAIGRVGSTGYSTGPHLHFEVLVDGDDVNPMQYYRKG